MDDRMWNVFLQTGNVEAYLLVKENERANTANEEQMETDVSTEKIE